MKKEIKDKIIFSKRMCGRIQSDARDVYYWLKLRDKKIAEEFGKKLEHIEVFFERKEKELIAKEEDRNKGTLVEKVVYEKPIHKTDDTIKKVWWKRFFLR